MISSTSMPLIHKYNSPLCCLDVDEAIRLEDDTFIACHAVKLFYVMYGRNAWYNIWVTKYFEDCMNINLDSAKKVAERHRTQGSVYYISEIPALQFISSKYSILVTEINTNQPLQYCHAISDVIPISTKVVFDHFTPPRDNSIIRLVRKHKRLEHTAGGMQKLQDMLNIEQLTAFSTFNRYEAFTRAKEYPLGWREVIHDISQSAVVRLAAQFDWLIVSQEYAAYKKTLGDISEILEKPITELKIPAIVLKEITTAGVQIIGDLVQFTERELEAVLSDVTHVKEIKRAFVEKAVTLKLEKSKANCNLSDTPVEDLELSVRTASALKNAKIISLGQLVELSEPELQCMMNMNSKSVNELKDVLSSFGLSLVD